MEFLLTMNNTIKEQKKKMTSMMWEVRELLVKRFLELLRDNPDSLKSADLSTIVKFLKDNEISLQSMDHVEEAAEEYLNDLLKDATPPTFNDEDFDKLAIVPIEGSDEGREAMNAVNVTDLSGMPTFPKEEAVVEGEAR